MLSEYDWEDEYPEEYEECSTDDAVRSRTAELGEFAPFVRPSARNRPPRNPQEHTGSIRLPIPNSFGSGEPQGRHPPRQPPDPEIRAEPPRALMRELPSADPFPVGALGDVLGPAAAAIHDRVRAPMAMCGQSVLAAGTLVVQGHANVVLPMGQARPISNYFVTVGVSGERKTAVDGCALRAVRTREAKLRAAYDAEYHDYRNEQEAWGQARAAAIKSAKGDGAKIKATLDAIGPPPDAPMQPTLTCSEPTYEGLTKLFATGWPSLGLFNDEGGQFIGGHGMNEEAKLRTATGLSKAWDGQHIERVRGGDGVSLLPDRRLAMHLMVQPGVASLLFDDGVLADQGLLSRVLPSFPESAIGARAWREPSDHTGAELGRYDASLLGILEKPLPLVAGKRDQLAPRELPLSDTARRLWIGFHNQIEARMGAGGQLEPVSGFANKLPEHAARIAGVLTLLREITAVEINEAVMQAGIDLAQYYVGEALRLHGASQVSGQLRQAQRLLAWLLDRPEPAISLPDIYQRGPNAVRDKSSAMALVEILVDHGWLVEIPGARTSTELGAVVRGALSEPDNGTL